MPETIEYQITKDKCQSMIKGVCSGCGGQLEPMETVDNSGNPTYWSGCPKCEVFDWGCDPLVFEIAKHMVTEDKYTHYGRDIIPSPEGKEESYKVHWLSSQIRGTTSLVRQVLNIHNSLKINEPRR